MSVMENDKQPYLECVQCGRLSPPCRTWDEAPGWGLLYGILAVCSRGCAEQFAKKSRYGVLRDGDVEFICGEVEQTP